MDQIWLRDGPGTVTDLEAVTELRVVTGPRTGMKDEMMSG